MTAIDAAVDLAGLFVLASSWAVWGPQNTERSKRALAIARYADPVALALVESVGMTLAKLPTVDESCLAVITISHLMPDEAARSVRAQLDQGVLRPSRFIAANPSAALGLTCAVFGIRGPTLALTMPATEAAHVAALLAAGWLSSGLVTTVLLCAVEDSTPLSVRCAAVALKGNHAHASATLSLKSPVDPSPD